MARIASFPNSVIEAGFWFLLAEDNRRESFSLYESRESSSAKNLGDPEETSHEDLIAEGVSLGLPHEMLDDLVDVLSRELEDLDKDPFQNPQVREIWQQILVGKYWITQHPRTTISAKRYEYLRSQVIAQRETQSGKGEFRWPTTCQTVSKRFGGAWNEALKHFGMQTTLKGRARGALKFSMQDYHDAGCEFLRHCRSQRLEPTVSYYSQWVKDQSPERSWPSAAAQRQIRGLWSTVIDDAASALHIEQAQ
ncbi:MAG: hypothetical protein Q4G30_07750 [Actinomycetaceae bacterium]|nr:hypothetical protein [Actinomycetaceae bacterium]